VRGTIVAIFLLLFFPTASTPTASTKNGGPWTRVVVTAYCPERVCVGSNVTHGRTRLGIHPVIGVSLAVDPTVFPLDRYWELCYFLDGREVCQVVHSADTGRVIKGRKVDLFLHSVDEAVLFGLRRGRLRPWVPEIKRRKWRKR